MRGYVDESVAACGAWTANNSYEIRICYSDSIFCPVFRFQYMNGDPQLEVEPNVSWGTTTVTTIMGHATR